MSEQQSWFINACKSMKMALEVSQEVLPDQAFLLARSQVAPHSACPTACPARSLLDMLFLRPWQQAAGKAAPTQAERFS